MLGGEGQEDLFEVGVAVEAATAAGVSLATTSPRARKITRSVSISTSRMSWLVTSSAAPLVAQNVSSPERTLSAMSGSSDAVGSSRTSSAGSCKVALTMPTSVRWPGGQLRAEPVGEVGDLEPFERLADRRAVVADAVPAGEHAERFAHLEPIGQREVAGREADDLHRPAAMTRECVAADRDLTVVGRDRSEQHQQRRRLAGTVGSEQADPLAGRDRDVDVAHGFDILEPLAQRTSFEHVTHPVASLARCARPPSLGFGSPHDRVSNPVSIARAPGISLPEA